MSKSSKGCGFAAARAISSLLMAVSLAPVSLAANAAAAAETPAVQAAAAQAALLPSRASEAARTPPKAQGSWGSQSDSGPPAGALVLAGLAAVALVAHRRLGQ